MMTPAKLRITSYLQLVVVTLNTLAATVTCNAAGQGQGQNLTTYLLTRYASTYRNVTTQPAFFSKVLNGTVEPAQVAYFFEQDTIYGRGFTGLCANTLTQLSRNLTSPTTNRTLSAIDNLGGTASGLADEDGRLTALRDQLDPGTAAQALQPSAGTRAYVEYMRAISKAPNDPFAAFVCSWTMGRAFVDVWTNIQKHQVNIPNKIPQLQTIIDYWADPSYIAAIDETGDLIDEWWATAAAGTGAGAATAEGAAKGTANETGTHPWPHVADQVFLDTLQREAAFWVSVDSMGEQ